MKNKAIFLDRDDTLIADPGYINDPKQVRLLPAAADGLKQLRQMGYKLVVVTNQSAVARGIVTEEVLRQIHDQLIELLKAQGAVIDKIYYCPYHPDGVIEKYRKDSELRKPSPGMILKAAEEMDIDLAKSWMVGNSYRDISAGVRGGCRTILLDTSMHHPQKRLGDPTPDKIAINLKEVVNIIKMFDRKNIKPAEVETKTVQAPEPAKTAQVPEPAKTAQVPEPAETANQMALPIEQPAAEAESKEPAAIENIMQKKAPQFGQVKTAGKEPTHTDRTHRLLEDIVKQLKLTHRGNMFEEFSSMKMVAGVVQALVVFCLLISLWFLMDHTRSAGSVHTALGYAIVLQLMAIAFYIMRDRK